MGTTKLPLKLMALEPAFYNNNRIRRGEVFDFYGPEKDTPKWAVPEGTKLERQPAKFPGLVDTRPMAAIKASKAKHDADRGTPDAPATIA